MRMEIGITILTCADINLLIEANDLLHIQEAAKKQKGGFLCVFKLSWLLLLL
jgi:hypothetical protein